MHITLTDNVELIKKARPILQNLLDTNAGKYIDLFFHEKPAPLSETQASVLQKAGIIREYHKEYLANVMVFPFRGKFIVTDFLLSQYRKNSDGKYIRGLDDVWVMFPHETLLFIDNLDDISGDVALDMASGSGAISLFLAERFNRVIASDVNPKALSYTRFNAVLNNLEHKIESVQSDVFASLNGQKFDYICWNGPTVAFPEVESPERVYPLYTYGGFDGGQFTRRFLKEVMNHVKPGYKIKWWDGSLGDKNSSVIEKFMREHFSDQPLKITIDYLYKDGGQAVRIHDRMYDKYCKGRFDMEQGINIDKEYAIWYEKLKKNRLTKVYTSLISIEQSEKFEIIHTYPKVSLVSARHVFGFAWHAASKNFIRNYIKTTSTNSNSAQNH